MVACSAPGSPTGAVVPARPDPTVCLDQLQRPLKRPAIICHEGRGPPRPAVFRRAGCFDVRGHRFDQTADVRYPARRAPRSSAITLISLGLKHMRTEDDRHAHRAGLQQVVPADLHQAAADEGDVRGGIELLQFAHGVADHHIHSGRQSTGVVGPADDIVSGAPAIPDHFRRIAPDVSAPAPAGCAGKVDRSRAKAARTRRSSPRVSARGDEYEPLPPPIAAAVRLALVEQRLLDRRIELQIAGDVDQSAWKPRGPSSCPCVLAGLRAEKIGVRQHGVGSDRYAFVPPQGKPVKRVRSPTAVGCRVSCIRRRDLGQNSVSATIANSGFTPVHEPAHRRRGQIVGYVGVDHGGRANRSRTCLDPRRRSRGQHQPVTRVAPREGIHEMRGRPHFAHETPHGSRCSCRPASKRSTRTAPATETNTPDNSCRGAADGTAHKAAGNREPSTRPRTAAAADAR